MMKRTAKEYVTTELFIEYRKRTRDIINANARIREIAIDVLTENHKALEERIRALEQMRSNLEGRMWVVGIGIVIVQLILMKYWR